MTFAVWIAFSTLSHKFSKHFSFSCLPQNTWVVSLQSIYVYVHVKKYVYILSFAFMFSVDSIAICGCRSDLQQDFLFKGLMMKDVLQILVRFWNRFFFVATSKVIAVFETRAFTAPVMTSWLIYRVANYKHFSSKSTAAKMVKTRFITSLKLQNMHGTGLQTTIILVVGNAIATQRCVWSSNSDIVAGNCDNL